MRARKEELERLRVEVEQAQRSGDYGRASELQYGRIPELEREIAAHDGAAPVHGAKQMLKEQVDEEDIAEVVSRWTHIPVSRLIEGEVEKLVKMEERLHQRVVGQHNAVVAVANAMRRARAGLQDPNRPLGSFFFLGPTGVGKTELGRALAEFLFDDEQAMIRIDMSEYQEKHTVSRLIGAPPGYVGYEEAGQLTEAVRRRPYAVVLFDEVEKAHPEVFNVLLQLLDDGRLTDGKGRTVDFKNTVVIMTSNVRDEDTLRSHFRPEFLNRIDEIVYFDALSKEDIRKVIDIQLRGLLKRLAERKISLEISDAAKDLLAEEGYDPVYGARPLKRYIQRELETRVGRALVAGDVMPGSRVEVGVDGGALAIRVAAAQARTEIDS
jgi:ATP-dependent Clp protease ATP-binding subunit ClpB